MSGYRTLRHEKEYADALDALGEIDARYYESAAGLEWGIAKNPECYPALPSTVGVPGLRMAPGDAFAGLLPIRIFFAVLDDDTAVLLYIETVAVEDLLNELG